MNNTDNSLHSREVRDRSFGLSSETTVAPQTLVRVAVIVAVIVMVVTVPAVVGLVCRKGTADRAAYFSDITSIQESMGIVVTDADEVRSIRREPGMRPASVQTETGRRQDGLEKVMVTTTADENDLVEADR